MGAEHHKERKQHTQSPCDKRFKDWKGLYNASTESKAVSGDAGAEPQRVLKAQLRIWSSPKSNGMLLKGGIKQQCAWQRIINVVNGIRRPLGSFLQ